MIEAQHKGQVNLLNALLAAKTLKNDAALARELKVTQPTISKIRSGRNRVAASFILAVHEAFDMPVATIRTHLAGAA